jgi:hypothetical protein
MPQLILNLPLYSHLPPWNAHSTASKKAAAPPAKAKVAKSRPPKSKAVLKGNKRQRASSTESDDVVIAVQTRCPECTTQKKSGEQSRPPTKRTWGDTRPNIMDAKVVDQDESECEEVAIEDAEEEVEHDKEV